MVVVYILIVLIAILGAPLFAVIASTAILNFFKSGSSILIVPQEIAGIAKTPLLHSIPLFTFAGYLLAHSKASQRFVKLFMKMAVRFIWMVQILMRRLD